MDKIISLYGKYRGMARIHGDKEKVEILVKGAPNDSQIYLIESGGTRRFDGTIHDELIGILICKENSDSLFILMEGTIRGSRLDIEAIKRNLKSEYALSIKKVADTNNTFSNIEVKALKTDDSQKENLNIESSASKIKSIDEDSPKKSATFETARSEIGKSIEETAKMLFFEDAKRGLEITQQKNTAYNPFPDAFPTSSWKKVRYQGTNRHYLEGHAKVGQVNVIIHGIPGELHDGSSSHKGFNSFMRSTDGIGYWLRIRQE
ncbi:MAG: hypothetical protein RR398_02000 [Clostridia bacterium]